MDDYSVTFHAIQSDPRYRANVKWGEPRPGHPEGTIASHIAELERNLESLRLRFNDTDYWKLKCLIHTHDTFKADARTGAPITDPTSHASLAREFLAQYCDDCDLLAMVQYHDEPFALWQQFRAKGKCDAERIAHLLKTIKDWNLFLAFAIVDGCTEGKSREPLRWLFGEIVGKAETGFSAEDLL